MVEGSYRTGDCLNGRENLVRQSAAINAAIVFTLQCGRASVSRLAQPINPHAASLSSLPQIDNEIPPPIPTGFRPLLCDFPDLGPKSGDR